MTEDQGARPRGPRLRGVLDDIPVYKPGRPAVSAAGAPAYKLSSNENPYPPLPGVLEAAVAAAGALNRYPDLGCAALTAELAKRFDVPEAHIATGTGSVGVAQQLVQSTAGPGDEVIYAWRSFEAYPIITQISGARGVPVPLTDGDVHDLDAMADAVTERTRLIFVCNPNNPTGTVVHRAELERFLDRVPSDVLVVLDEAYCEFIRDPEVPDGVDWICVSPKAGAELRVRRGDELKLVYPQAGAMPAAFADLAFERFSLQPMDGPEVAANTERAVNYCIRHPQWRLSLQTHKTLGIR